MGWIVRCPVPCENLAMQPTDSDPLAPDTGAPVSPDSAQAHPPKPAKPALPPALPANQARNPLHGLTLEHIVTALADYYGWPGLGERIPVRCFTHDPSVASSLRFLRKTPWAREKVEGLYLFTLREQRRSKPR
jgi:hypothetical protein